VRQQGVLFAMREGRSKYITFIDSDDSIAKNYLSTLYQALSENKACASYCLPLLQGKKEKLQRRAEYKVIEVNEKTLPDLVMFAVGKDEFGFGHHRSVWAALYRIELFRNINWQLNFVFYGEDARLQTQLVANSRKIVNTGLRLYNYRTNPNSITYTLDEASQITQQENILKEGLELTDFLQKKGVDMKNRLIAHSFTLAFRNVNTYIDNNVLTKSSYQYFIKNFYNNFSQRLYHEVDLRTRLQINLLKKGLPVYKVVRKLFTFICKSHNKKVAKSENH
jgi:hypothetical protein